MREGGFVCYIIFRAGRTHASSSSYYGFADYTCNHGVKLVQLKKIMNYLLLPHELKKRHKTENFEHLRITHKFYTFRSGRGIPQIGRYGGLIWKILVSGYGCTRKNLLGKEFG